MIKFLKINDPYRVAVLAIAFLAIRGLFFSFDLHFTQPELRFFIAAKALGDGKWLYRDIWETTEPLATAFFYLLPRNNATFLAVAYWVNASIILFNAIYLNFLIQRLDILSEKTHLPAFFYLFLSLPFVELNTLSSALLASPFLLLVVGNMLVFLKKEDTQRVYNAGFFLGIATLFHLPCIALVVVMLISLIVFSRGTGIAFFLLLLGSLFPWFVLSVVYLWLGGLAAFWQLFIGHYFENPQTYFTWSETGRILLAPGLVFLFGLYLSLSGTVREINYQSVCRRFIFVWLIGSVFTCIISPISSFSLLHLLAFPLTFFMTYYYLPIRKTQLASIGLWIAMASMITMQVRSMQGISFKQSMIQLTVFETKSPDMFQKKILVAGDSSEYYLNSKIGTKYLNWNLSKIDFNNISTFSSVESIRKNLYEDLPEIIIDQEGIVPKLFHRIPELRTEYTLSKPGHYLLKNKGFR